MSTDSELPQDMRDLLIRLDERVKSGFESLHEQLRDVNHRADRHEGRIRVLETDSTGRAALIPRYLVLEGIVKGHEGRFAEIDGAGKGLGVVGKIGSAALGAAFAVVALLGFQLTIAPKSDVTKASTTIQHTQTLPAR